MTTGYTYDILNRLTEIKEASIEKITYEYDGNGLMQSKTDVETGTTTQFIYDGANIVAEVTNGVTTAYVRGVRLISMDNGEDKLYYHHNPHGDVEKLTNASGETIEEYTYDAYGNQRVSIGALNPFRYCGEYWDGPKTVGETQVGETVYVSDMAWISSSNGWGPVMRDHAHSGWDGNNLTPIT
ncbi:MAG: hypothetical protein LBL58_15385, partial [Tannerellaceae bacterium]|nr:hypothetical protein [Tannerellaceae bacterium]